jgi:hypothetical protein
MGDFRCHPIGRALGDAIGQFAPIAHRGEVYEG